MSRACYKCLCCNRTGVKWLAALSVTGLLAFVSTRFWSDPGRLVKVHRNYDTFPAVVQHNILVNHTNLPLPNETDTTAATGPTHSRISSTIKAKDGGFSLGPRNKPYTLALGYTEQLSAATHTMFALGALASDWGTQMVEPFVTKSFIFGLQNIVPPVFAKVDKKQTIRLFELYDSTEVNKVIHAGVSPNVTMVDLETFLADASRDVTVFHFRGRSNTQTERIFALDDHDSHLLESAFPKDKTESVLECLSMKLQSIKNLIDSIETELNTRVKKSRLGTIGSPPNMTHFKVKRVLCLDPHSVYRSDTLQKHIPAENTVIFTNWRGCGLKKCFFTNDIDDDKQTPEWKEPFRYAIRTRTRVNQQLKVQHQLHHLSIEKTAKHYLNYLQYKHPFISVHVRSERVVRIAKERAKDPVPYINYCLKNLSAILNNLTQETFSEQDNDKHRILLVTDVGSNFGTSTCRGRRCQRTDTDKVTSRLHELGLYEQFYDPKVYNGVQNSGYVSLVEMHMLASADKLVLVGFGGFQAILESLFLSHGHHSEDVFHICNK